MKREGNALFPFVYSGKWSKRTFAPETYLVNFFVYYEPNEQKSRRELGKLWREHIFGLNGRKPVRLFITAERNRNEIKQKYYRRNVIWECMARLVILGRTPEQAADELYKIYGNKTPVKKMSDMIVKDRMHYGCYHPNL